MALPSSGPISGSQIATELGLTGLLGTNLSLGGMVASSSLDIEQPYAYSDFYGYSHVTTTSFLSSTARPKNGCGISTSNTTYYHDGSGAGPAVGDIVYSDAAGTTPVSGGQTRYFNSGGGGSNKFVIETPFSGPNTGLVTSIGICI